MSGEYRERHAAMMRRMLLEALQQEPNYMAPDLLLQDALESQAMAVGMDRLRTELAWLAEQGLVERTHGANVLSLRGSDVALGRVDVPGVQRRPPGGMAGVGASLLAQRLRGEG